MEKKDVATISQIVRILARDDRQSLIGVNHALQMRGIVSSIDKHDAFDSSPS